MADLAVTVSPPRTGGAQAGDVILRTRRLSKRYGQRLAVNNLSLEVYRGEIFGFLGPNGAGKTTTIRMVLRLITPTSGAIEILGQDVGTSRAEFCPASARWSRQPALYLYMSGRDNLRAVGSVLGGVPETRMDDVLELVG